MTTVNNSKLAKNTLLLYVRMLLIMVVSLYTSRVVLAALGVDDFGIYNVVGGFVSMFSIVSASLTAGISRFITYELGRKDDGNLQEVFATSIFVQIVLGLIILFFAETVGLWFLNTRMNIASERMTAANWVFQCSVITFVINLLSVPYNAAIIAYEKMSAFAYISIVEAVVKLFIAFVVTWLSANQLIVYAVLILLSSVLVRVLYTSYCNRNFEKCRVKPKYNKKIFREIAAFSGWNFIGSTSGILRDQGVNVLLNIFCGTAVNAARGIATQVNCAVSNFSQNFLTAVNPQIIKNYAADQREQSFSLAFSAAKFAFFILLLPGVPLLLNTPLVLSIWLKEVPDYAAVFTQLSIIMVLSEVISLPLITIMLANGNIRMYQIVVGGIQLLNFPLSYLALKLGFAPESTYVIAIACSLLCLAMRLIMLRRQTGLSIGQYMKLVFFRVCLVSAIVSGVMIPLNRIFQCNFGGLVCSSLTSVVIVGLIVYLFGCTKGERSIVIAKVKQFMTKTK